MGLIKVGEGKQFSAAERIALGAIGCRDQDGLAAKIDAAIASAVAQKDDQITALTGRIFQLSQKPEKAVVTKAKPEKAWKAPVNRKDPKDKPLKKRARH